MANHKTENSSFQIKGYVNKLYGEIVEEMDTFLSDRDLKPAVAKPFSDTFSQLGKTVPNPKRPNSVAWGTRGNLRNKYFSFASKPAEKPSSLFREPSSRFLSSFEKKESSKGFDSRKYFAPEADKASDIKKTVNTATKSSFQGEWQSIWTKPLAEKKEEKPSNPIPSRTSPFTGMSVFGDTTSNIIPSLKSSLETILGGEKKKTVYTPINLFPSPKIASTVEIRTEEISNPEMESLLSPLAGMPQGEKKVNSFPENNLEKEIEDFITSPSRLVLQESFWQTLESEESLGDLFDGVEPSVSPSRSIFEPEFFNETEKVAELVAKEMNQGTPQAEIDLGDEIEFYVPREKMFTPPEARVLAEDSQALEELTDPFFESLEEAFAVPSKPLGAHSFPEPIMENPLDLEPSALSPNVVSTPNLGSLEWAGEIRWHLVEKSQLASFEEHLPAGFVLCDGSALLGQGSLQMKADQIVGTLPRWIEDVDATHVVVGIMRAHKS